MRPDSPPASRSTSDPTQLLSTFAEVPLTIEQLERLRWCANGNTLRFEASTIVEALVAGGYAKQGFGRVVTVTPKGEEYLRTNATATVSVPLEHGDGQVLYQRIAQSPGT